MKYIFINVLIFCTITLVAQGKFGGGNGSGNTSTKIENIALPIVLIDFSVILTDKNDVLIQWKTATEYDNDYFVIEKSADALYWTTLGTLKGAGNSQHENHYEMIDSNPFQRLSYYRIQQVDFNGNVSYSNIASIMLPNTPFTVYPNPAKERLNIFVSSTESVVITLSNSTGKKVFQKRKNNSRLTIDISHLPNGLYVLTVTNNSISTTEQIIIQH